MIFAQFADNDKWRAARHEGGHWLASKKYGFNAGAILIIRAENQFGAEINYPAPHEDAQSQITYCENRMRVVIAGFVGQAVPRFDGTKRDDLDFPPEWKPYSQIKHDYERFAELVGQIMPYSPPPTGCKNPVDWLFNKLRPEVEDFLRAEAKALDAIQDAVLSCKGDSIPAEVIEKLRAVGGLHQAPELVSGSASPFLGSRPTDSDFLWMMTVVMGEPDPCRSVP